MRHLRVLSGLVAVFAMVLLAFSPAPAQADESTADNTTTQRAQKTKHKIRNLRATEIRDTGRFVVRGKVTTFKGKKVKLQRSKSGKGHWRTIKKERTKKSTGAFSIRFDGPIGTCYRIAVPKTRKHKFTTKRFGCIVAS